MRTHTTAVLRNELARRVFQHATAAPGDPQVCAERQVTGGDLLAEAGAAARNENALTFEQAFLEHGALRRTGSAYSKPGLSPARSRRLRRGRTTSSPWPPRSG